MTTLQPFKYDYLSDHVLTARYRRFCGMMEKVGYNGIICSIVDDLNPAHVQHITDTGIIFITGKDKEGKVVVITGYLLSIDKAKAIFKDERMPQVLYNSIINNMREHADQYDKETLKASKKKRKKKV